MNPRNRLFLKALAIILLGCHSRSEINASGRAGHTHVALMPALYFDADSADIRDEELIDNNARWLKKHRHRVVILEGHSDAWGDRNYNLLLGDRRARNVMRALMRRGIPESRLIIVSYGEDRPAVRGVFGGRKNRRVEFVVR